MAIRRTIPDDCGGKYVFNAKKARKAVSFFPRFIRLSEGEWFDKPMVLMDWQEQIVSEIFGWVHADTGHRRYRVVYVWIPRKNTKSTTAAGIALLLLIGDGEHAAQVYSIASNEDQAAIVFDMAATMVAQSEELSRLVTPFKKALWIDSLGAVFRYLTGKGRGKHGKNVHGLIGDEIHEWASDDLYTFLRQSQGTRREPMNFLISTAGQRDGVGWEHFQLCEAILNGEVHEENTYVFIAAADAAKDAQDPNYWTTEEAVRESNPGLGTTVKLDFIMGEINSAKTNLRKINDVKRYLLNLWVDQATVWLDMNRWDDCGFNRDVFDDQGKLLCPAEPQPELDRSTLPVMFRGSNLRWKAIREANRGRRCLVGIDLSSTTDLSSVVFVFPPDDTNDRWVLLPLFFVPRGEREDDLDKRKKRDKFDYRQHAEVGALILTDGDVIDYDVIFSTFKEYAQDFEVGAVGLDRWNATSMATSIANEGFEVSMFGQGFGSMSGPTKYLERKTLQRKIDHGGHPVLRWNARNVAVTQDAAENVKPAKDKATGRIDGIVAAIIGIGISDEFADEGPSAYRDKTTLAGVDDEE